MYYSVVIGSGVAASSCVNELLSLTPPSKTILMISSCPNIKMASRHGNLGQILQKINVHEIMASKFCELYDNLIFLLDTVISNDAINKSLVTKSGKIITYEKLVICTGSIPKTLPLKINPQVTTSGAPSHLGSFEESNKSASACSEEYNTIIVNHKTQPFMKPTPQIRDKHSKIPETLSQSELSSHARLHYLRDLDSVNSFRAALEKSTTVCIIGNGGIAMELVFEITGCEVHWIVKHDYIGNRFFDKETSLFFNDLRNSPTIPKKGAGHPYRRYDFSDYHQAENLGTTGSAVGPDWSRKFPLRGCSTSCPEYPDNIKIHLHTNVKALEAIGDVIRVETDSGLVLECDLVIVAIGITPNVIVSPDLNLNDRGAIIVDENMRTSILDVFAAGDCVEMRLENDDRRKWFQMPLWSQAMHMGMHAAHCMVNSSIELPIEFELFTHATQFFGFKVCLMGLYNGQGMSELHTVSYRRSSETEFVRLILYEGRIVGAVLIGDTGIENTIENLILSEMDVSAYGEYIISPDFDISDYFD